MDSDLFTSSSQGHSGLAALKLVASYKSHIKCLVSYEFSSWLHQKCTTPQHLAHDCIQQPFCSLVTADPLHFQIDRPVDNLRQNLTSRIVETEGRRLRQ
jgi:hypothetical protein